MEFISRASDSAGNPANAISTCADAVFVHARDTGSGAADTTCLTHAVSWHVNPARRREVKGGKGTRLAEGVPKHG